MRKPSVFLVFLFLVALGLSELREHIQLSDDVSNDLIVSACGRQSAQPRTISQQGAPALGSGSVEVFPAQKAQNFLSPLVIMPFHQSGQDRLLLWSVQRT